MGCTLAYLAFRFSKYTRSTSTFNGIVNSIPIDYINLFDSASQQKLLANYSQMSKVRNANSVLLYELKYTILIYKVSLNSNYNIKDLIRVEHGVLSQSERALYMEALAAPINININTDSIPMVSNLILTLPLSSLLHYSQSDSLYCINTTAGNFALRYGNDSPVDLIAKSKQEMPLSIAFKICGKSLYILFMMPNDKTLFDKPIQLCSLLKR